MERRQLGATDMQVSVLGFGSYEIGAHKVSPAEVSRLLNTALDAGLNLIDTAECYPGSEELIGNAVGHRRAEYHLLSKCGHASGLDLPDWDPKLLALTIDRSLQRLQTDHLDLLQLHTCSEDALRQGEVIAVIQKAKAAGKTRYLGYSGDDQAALYAVQCGAFDTLQTSLSIADQQAIDLTLPLARQRNMGVIVKRPIANAVWCGAQRPENAYYQPYWDRLGELAFDWLAAGPEVSVGKALRFTLSTPGVHTAIVGTTRPQRWQQNASLLAQGPLLPAEYDAIRARWKALTKPTWIGQT